LREPIEAGQILRDRYLVQSIIGRGGMGSIYLSEDTRLPGRICAIKEVRQDIELPETLREEAREQFYREASVLARLDHPNLPKVSDYFSGEDRDFLVMDYVPGDDLKTLMDRERRRGGFLQIDDVMTWAYQLADALAYMHSQEPPVVHRDLKPSNLKITPSGLLKLVDFGLVKLMAPDEVTVTVIQGRGTALYTPLEQYGGDTGHTDARSDIYAFGATLYHILTNRPPLEAKQRFLQPDALQPPRKLNPAIPPAVEEAILWAMALHPDDRPQDVGQLRNALALGRGSSETLSPGTAQPWPDIARLLPTEWDRRLAFVIAVLVVMAVLTTFR
jgi:serine/threonine protein kinase